MKPIPLFVYFVKSLLYILEKEGEKKKEKKEEKKGKKRRKKEKKKRRRSNNQKFDNLRFIGCKSCLSRFGVKRQDNTWLRKPFMRPLG